MRTNSFYPVILTRQVTESAAFYTAYFGFQKVYEADWYVSLKKEQGDTLFELAVLNASHPTIPAASSHRAGLFSFRQSEVPISSSAGIFRFIHLHREHPFVQ